MNLLWCAAKYKQLTMHVSLQVMSNFADTMLAIASRSRIITTSIQAEVVPSLELVDELPTQPSEDHKSGQKNINSPLYAN